ncbi:hypothetical protein ABKN59_011896 [Abortiporus biennis]
MFSSGSTVTHSSFTPFIHLFSLSGAGHLFSYPPLVILFAFFFAPCRKLNEPRKPKYYYVIAAPYDESYSTFALRAPEPRYRYRRSSYDRPSLNARSFNSVYSDLYARDYYDPSSMYRRDYASPVMDMIYSREDGYSAPELYRRARGGQQVPSSYLTGSTNNPPPRSNGQTSSTSLPIGPPQSFYAITRSKPDAINPANGGSSAQPPAQAPTRNTTPAVNKSRGGQQIPAAQAKQLNTAYALTKPKQ